MLNLQSKNLALFFSSLTVVGVILIWVPYFLGTSVAFNQWNQIILLLLGGAVMALFFLDRLYLVFVTFACVIGEAMGSTILPFSLIRWVFMSQLALFGVLDSILSRVPFKLRVVDFWAFCFMSLCFYSQSYSFKPDLTFQRSCSLVIFFLAVFRGIWNYFEDEKKIISLGTALVRGSFYISVIGFLFWRGGRFSGIFCNPNAVGLLVTLVFPLALQNYFSTRSKISGFVLFVFITNLILCQARAGLLATLLSASFFLWFYDRTNKYVIATVFLLGGVSIFLIIELFNGGILSSFLRFETLDTGGGRLQAWRELIRLIGYRPWLGYGFGTEDHIFEKFNIIFDQHAGLYAHNSYLGLVTQVGFVGAALFFLPMIFFIVLRGFSIMRNRHQDTFGLELALLASIIGGMIHAVFESWMYSAGNPLNLIFWILLACLYRFAMNRKQFNSAISTGKMGEHS